MYSLLVCLLPKGNTYENGDTLAPQKTEDTSDKTADKGLFGCTPEVVL